MKNLVIGFMLGILFLKGSHSLYSYVWWSAEATEECRVKRAEDVALTCIYEKMGPTKYLAIPLQNLDYTWQKWQLRY